MTHLIVVPTARAIRSIALAHEDGFLPHMIRVHELFERVTQSEFPMVSKSLQDFLLFEASKQTKLSALKIPTNFFSFIENASYMIRFLEEMALEGVSFHQLHGADTYAEYENHLEILQTFQTNYYAVLHNHHLSDKMFRPKDERLSHFFLSQFEHVEFRLHGYLSHYEQQLLLHCAKYSHLEVCFIATAFNEKMHVFFNALGFKIPEMGHYSLDFSTHESNLIAPISSISHTHLHLLTSRFAQIGFMFNKIEQWIANGVCAEEIIVVLPDERYALSVKEFDIKGNLNFSMGFEITHTLTVQILDALLMYVASQSVENTLRINRLVTFDYAEFIATLQAPFSKDIFEQFISTLLEQTNEKHLEPLLFECMENILALHAQALAFTNQQAWQLFTTELKRQRIDDTRGGKITVVGILETRGCAFEHVIILDFNDAYVPKRSDKDLYINDQARQIANLPTKSDREALQKQYYYELLLMAKEVVITAVDDYQNPVSSFAMELDVEITTHKDNNFEQILMPQTLFIQHEEEREIIFEHNVGALPLSATKLASYLRCKRQYYYRYIEKIYAHEHPQELSSEHHIGRILHQSIDKFFKTLDSISTFESFENAFYELFKQELQQSVFDTFMLTYWKKKLHQFLRQEFDFLQQGGTVVGGELPRKADVHGMTLTGVIDRINTTKEGVVEIVDFKSSKVPTFAKQKGEDITDFQMEFYALLYSDATQFFYYDLLHGKKIPYQSMEQKMPLLEEHLHRLQHSASIEFSKCDSLFTCNYCAYRVICRRA